MKKTNVLIGQEYNSSAQGLSLYSATSGGTANATNSKGSHSHYMIATADYQSSTWSAIAYGGVTAKQSGNKIALSNSNGSSIAYRWASSQSAGAHTHNVYLRGTGETRGANFSVRIWKRTS